MSSTTTTTAPAAAATAPYLDSAELLGQSVKLLSDDHNPFDITRLIAGRRKIVLLDVKNTKEVGTASGVGFKIPAGIGFTGIGSTETHSLTVETGTELGKSLDAQAEMSASYAGVSAEGSAKYSYQTALSTSKYYGLLSSETQSFMLTMELADLDLADGFVTAAQGLPDWPSSGYPSAALLVENHMCDTASKEEMQAHISCECNGIATAKASTDLKTSEGYKKYTKVRKFKATVIGGDPGKKTDLSSSPNDAAKFDEWEKSISDSTAHSPISLGVMSLGDIVAECKDIEDSEEREKLADKLNAGLSYMNSFRIVQGYLEVKSDYFWDRKYDLRIDGPPGMKLSASAYPTSKEHTTFSQESDTHVKIACPRPGNDKKYDYKPDKAWFDSHYLAYVRLTAPPFAVDWTITLEPRMAMRIKLTNGPDIRTAEMTEDSLVEEVSVNPLKAGVFGKSEKTFK
ncbi:hypothetical protein ASPZODRAFT_147205 [Penicilliopsis zonata CBS 506.65]|uniref:MACPF domain-containing protein n=1 Tax=Penicilliopsis zonata CBS 506.65 TaxID=1073090 RepID=A0A1L9S5X1_9EURO|nr:hypothetical protein ASPZODRAFT_147205 [Penicilliopsis zonata CBS 506.65]OJJ42566.1 hypothetical protein ASPZODRAFT_147205 [Penicilliopsis zonata CBS 506.65]